MSCIFSIVPEMLGVSTPSPTLPLLGGGSLSSNIFFDHFSHLLYTGVLGALQQPTHTQQVTDTDPEAVMETIF